MIAEMREARSGTGGRYMLLVGSGRITYICMHSISLLFSEPLRYSLDNSNLIREDGVRGVTPDLHTENCVSNGFAQSFAEPCKWPEISSEVPSLFLGSDLVTRRFKV